MGPDDQSKPNLFLEIVEGGSSLIGVDEHVCIVAGL
jgi:hypothetical protein